MNEPTGLSRVQTHVPHDSELAEALFVADARGTQIAPPSRSLSLGEGYAVQQETFRLRHVPVAGWKLALTSVAAQRAAGTEHPVLGRLPAAAIRDAPQQVQTTAGPLYAEAELAVTLARDLPARTAPYVASEVAAAVGDIHAAIELCTSRFEDDDVGPGLLIADNAFAHVFVVGDRLSRSWESDLEALSVELVHTGGLSVEGSTSAVMGNPLHALLWLANWLSEEGIGLLRGQVVATGSCTGVVEVGAGEHLRALFGTMGKAEVTILARNAVRRLG